MSTEKLIASDSDMNFTFGYHKISVRFTLMLVSLQEISTKLSKDLGIPQTRVSEILKGNRRITADTALRLSQYFGNSADFWLGIQDEYDLRK